MMADGGNWILVKAREAKVVALSGDGESTKRTGHFLKPTASFCHETALPVFKSPPACSSRRGARFKGWCYPKRKWRDWVQRMEAIHGGKWEEIGIRPAINASTRKVTRQPDLVWALVAYWCPETSTFVFRWGEATVTLEDVAVLGGFPLLGKPVKLGRRPARTDKGVLGELKCLAHLHQKLWLSSFMDAEKGRACRREELEHIAFLSLWLSRFVFPGPDENHMGQHVFPVAVRLARGERIALAPAVLAGLYRDLRLLKDHSCRQLGESSSHCAVSAPFQLLQLWVWERFASLRPEASPRRLLAGEPRAARWHAWANKNLNFSFIRSIMSSGDGFQWRPYATSLDKMAQSSFYRDVGEWVDGSSTKDEELLAFSRCLAPCELVGLDSIEQYLPHRVAMQFGLDQDLPGSVLRVDRSWKQAWATYDKPIDKVKFYIPPRMSGSVTTLQYRMWWTEYVSPESTPCDREELPPLEGKRKRGRPRKSPIKVSSTDENGGPMLFSPTISAVRKRKRGRSRKLSTLLSCSNEVRSSELASSPASMPKKRGRPRLSTKLCMGAPEEGNTSCHVKAGSKMWGDVGDESLAIASQVNTDDAQLSHGGQSLNLSKQIIMYKRRKVGKSALSYDVIGMEAGGATKDTSKTSISSPDHSDIIVVEGDEVRIPVKHEHDENTARSEEAGLRSELNQIKEMIRGYEAGCSQSLSQVKKTINGLEASLNSQPLSQIKEMIRRFEARLNSQP